MSDIFPILILNARPAAGKSEIIDYLHSLSDRERAARFHLGAIEEINDFPMLWTWFEEDAILEEMGQTRLHTDADGFFLFDWLWNVLIRRICLEYSKKSRDRADLHDNTTVVMEFSRGAEHGGYRSAYDSMDEEVLATASVLYVDVSYEESVRKNLRRFNPDKPDSILEHGLPADKMERLYKTIDWESFAQGDADYLRIKETSVPYVVMDNADDVTTRGGEELGARLETVLEVLWELYSRRLTKNR